MRFWFQTVFSEGRIWSSADFRGIDSNSLLGITLNYVGSLGIIWGNLGKEIWAGPKLLGKDFDGATHAPAMFVIIVSFSVQTTYPEYDVTP